MKNRYHKAGLCAAAFLFLTAGRLEVFPLPDTVVPADQTVPVGKEFSAKPGDVVLRGHVVRTKQVTTSDPVTVSIAKFTDSLPAGTELTPIVVTPQKSGPLSGGGLYYCGKDQRARSKLMGELVGDIGSKFENTVRFCFVDSDEDGRLEKVFLGGAKDAEFQTPVAIAPVAYSERFLVPRKEEDEIRLIYKKFNPETRRITLQLELVRDGKEEYFDFILSAGRSGGKPSEVYKDIRTNPKKIDYPVVFTDVLGSEVAIHSVDASSGEAKFAIRQNFALGLFRPVAIQHQTIYVYVYRGG